MKLQTRAVLAAAYPGGRKARIEAIRTHSVEVDDRGDAVRVLCKRVKLDSLCDEGVMDVRIPPTCPACLRAIELAGVKL